MKPSWGFYVGADDEGVVYPKKAGKGSREKGAETGAQERGGATAGSGVLANHQD